MVGVLIAEDKTKFSYSSENFENLERKEWLHVSEYIRCKGREYERTKGWHYEQYEGYERNELFLSRTIFISSKGTLQKSFRAMWFLCHVKSWILPERITKHVVASPIMESQMLYALRKLKEKRNETLEFKEMRAFNDSYWRVRADEVNEKRAARKKNVRVEVILKYENAVCNAMNVTDSVKKGEFPCLAEINVTNYNKINTNARTTYHLLSKTYIHNVHQKLQKQGSEESSRSHEVLSLVNCNEFGPYQRLIMMYKSTSFGTYALCFTERFFERVMFYSNMKPYKKSRHIKILNYVINKYS